MWYLPIDSSFSYSLSRQLFSRHAFVQEGYDNSGDHASYYLTSPHANVHSKENPIEPFYKLKGILRLINSLLYLEDSPQIRFHNYIYYSEDNANTLSSVRISEGNFNFDEYLYLVDPFADFSEEQEEELSNLNDGSRKGIYIGDGLELAYNYPLVAETLAYFSMLRAETVYFLINAAKIRENIKFDLENDLKEVYDSNIPFQNRISQYRRAIDASGFYYYANNTVASGILSRHGTTGDKRSDNFPPLDLVSLNYNLSNLINEWLSVKMQSHWGSHYHRYKK